MSYLFLKKNINQLLSDANGSDHTDKDGNDTGGGLTRTLGAFDITMLGVGAIIGAGIFSLTGQAAASYSGPGIVFSFAIGAFLCSLAGLCYAELAAMIPVSGSAYAYSYTTMGEGMAWIIGWTLVLEYAFGASVVANSWSAYLVTLIHTLGLHMPDSLLYYTKGPWELVQLSNNQQVFGIWNVPATCVVILVASMLYRGSSKSAKMNTIIVILKMAIVLLFIGLGITLVSKTNLMANPNASNFIAALVPPQESFIDPKTGIESLRYGWLNGGVLTGAGMVFFAYIGLDAVSTVAQESKNPKRDMPIGILASLFICALLYILVGITLTGIVPYKLLNTSSPIGIGIDTISTLRGWTPTTTMIVASLVKFGALAGLTSVVLVFTMGQTRIFYSISKDGLLPFFHKLHPKYRSPHIATVFTGIFIAVCGGLLPIKLVANLVSLGTLLVFLIVCATVPILRITNPKAERPFKVPFMWVISIGGVISCSWLMSSIDFDTWMLLVSWLIFGIGIYFTYGRRHSVSQLNNGYVFGPKIIDYVGTALFTIGFMGILKAVILVVGIINKTILITTIGITPIIVTLLSIFMAIYGFRMMHKNVKTV
jgi:APA family basic amino acid/polyamine antiporter